MEWIQKCILIYGEIRKKPGSCLFYIFFCVYTDSVLIKYLFALNFTNSVDIIKIHFTRCFAVISLYCPKDLSGAKCFFCGDRFKATELSSNTAKADTKIKTYRVFSATLSTLSISAGRGTYCTNHICGAIPMSRDSMPFKIKNIMILFKREDFVLQVT